MTPSHSVIPDKNFKTVASLSDMTSSSLREFPVPEKSILAGE